jgi:hypothetical protein
VKTNRVSVDHALLLCGWGVVLGASVFANARGDGAVDFPEGYRGWFRVKSALVSDKHPDFATSGGFRHIYANPQAIAGYKDGTFADGSAIVVDWIHAVEKNGAFNEGTRRRIDVMVKDRARFGATGGWGFEQFRVTARISAWSVSPRLSAMHVTPARARATASSARSHWPGDAVAKRGGRGGLIAVRLGALPQAEPFVPSALPGTL